jgi:hypothetical protein
MALISLGDLDGSVTKAYGPQLRSRSAGTIFEEETKLYPMDYQFDIFLSHSYNDARMTMDRLLGLKAILGSFDYKVYVDWIIDSYLDRETVSSKTARTLRIRMDHSKSLVFTTSQNSQNSLWMPWELGYKDGNTAEDGELGMVAILPIAQYQGQTTFQGQEYLGMYPFIDYANNTLGRQMLWVNQNGKSVSFDAWIGGSTPR